MKIITYNNSLNVSDTLEHFLDQVAQQGSWYGGGSVSALSAALAAALLEKLLGSAGPVKRLTRIRRECLHLARQDAVVFARVIAASRSGNRRAFGRTLKAATDIPCRVFEHAGAIRAISREAASSIKPQFRADVVSARAMAAAAAEGAQALITTNLGWLNDRTYTRTIRRRLSR